MSDERKSAGGKTVPQHEIDAQLLREKSARLRELRLKQEAAGGGVEKRSVRPARKSGATGKEAGKGGGKGADKEGGSGVSLSEWLNSQERQGRRN